MNNTTDSKRVLALDVRPRSFGFAVFEGPGRLLDWGVQSFRKGANAVRIPLATKIVALLEDFQPATVVAKEPPSRMKVNRVRTRKILELIRHKAGLRGIRTRVFKRRAVRNPFGGEEQMTKFEIATALAERFAELAPLLPPKRKPWQSEDYRMSIFDAAALGIAHFRRGTSIDPPEPSGQPPSQPSRGTFPTAPYFEHSRTGGAIPANPDSPRGAVRRARPFNSHFERRKAYGTDSIAHPLRGSQDYP